jgi:hypothetical protein
LDVGLDHIRRLDAGLLPRCGDGGNQHEHGICSVGSASSQMPALTVNPGFPFWPPPPPQHTPDRLVRNHNLAVGTPDELSWSRQAPFEMESTSTLTRVPVISRIFRPLPCPFPRSSRPGGDSNLLARAGAAFGRIRHFGFLAARGRARLAQSLFAIHLREASRQLGQCIVAGWILAWKGRLSFPIRRSAHSA